MDDDELRKLKKRNLKEIEGLEKQNEKKGVQRICGCEAFCKIF